MNTDANKILLLAKAGPFLLAIHQEGSFAKAAEKLAIDQSAVSHRIRQLEEALDLTLFNRTTRRLSPTRAGETLSKAAADSSAIWAEALQDIQRQQRSDHIRLTLPSSLAMKWLLPALPRARDFDLSLSIDASDHLADLNRQEADAAIRFGPGPYPGLHASFLCPCDLTPVMSASLPDLPDDYFDRPQSGELPLLADRRGEADATAYNWDSYLTDDLIPSAPIPPHLSFDRADLLIQAAASGLGVALGRTLLIEQDLAAGFLKVAGPRRPSTSKYWLVCTAEFAASDSHNRLLTWLKEEVNNNC
ncbi:LysR family transcriptional regulator [Rhodovibrionaceae bacterium A322]